MPSLREWLAAEPFALGLSSGFFGFFAHTGVCLALAEAGLVGARFAGASAGALVGGALAAGLPATRLAEELVTLERHDFWDPRPGLGLLRGAKFRARLAALLPVPTFADCPRPLCVSAFDLVARRTRVIDAGPLAAGIHASCAVPLLFHPVRLDGRWLADGGVADRPGLAGLPDGTRLFFHHLASRSPWRRRNSPALAVPARPNMATLILHGLPRLGPFRLAEGARTIRLAAAATARALELPLEDERVELDVGADASSGAGSFSP